jgi:hypothetical protein
MADPVEEVFQDFTEQLAARFAASTDVEELIRNAYRLAGLDPDPEQDDPGRG